MKSTLTKMYSNEVYSPPLNSDYFEFYKYKSIRKKCNLIENLSKFIFHKKY